MNNSANEGVCLYIEWNYGGMIASCGPFRTADEVIDYLAKDAIRMIQSGLKDELRSVTVMDHPPASHLAP